MHLRVRQPHAVDKHIHRSAIHAAYEREKTRKVLQARRINHTHDTPNDFLSQSVVETGAVSFCPGTDVFFLGASVSRPTRALACRKML